MAQHCTQVQSFGVIFVLVFIDICTLLDCVPLVKAPAFSGRECRRRAICTCSAHWILRPFELCRPGSPRLNLNRECNLVLPSSRSLRPLDISLGVYSKMVIFLPRRVHRALCTKWAQNVACLLNFVLFQRHTTFLNIPQQKQG